MGSRHGQFAGKRCGRDDRTVGLWGPPVPRPRQVFAIGLNYRGARLGGSTQISTVTHTVFAEVPHVVDRSSMSSVRSPPDPWTGRSNSWVVIGRRCDFVGVDDAWDHVAGLTVGQDLWERQLQLAGSSYIRNSRWGNPYRGFAPLGPELVTVDEFHDHDNVELGCRLDGGESAGPHVGADLLGAPAGGAPSSVCPLLPGDLIFTGTPRE